LAAAAPLFPEARARDVALKALHFAAHALRLLAFADPFGAFAETLITFCLQRLDREATHVCFITTVNLYLYKVRWLFYIVSTLLHVAIARAALCRCFLFTLLYGAIALAALCCTLKIRSRIGARHTGQAPMPGPACD
jgi:hypothetical protein